MKTMKTMMMVAVTMMLVAGATVRAEPTVKFTYLLGADEMIMTVDLDGKTLVQVLDDSCVQLAEGKTPEGWGLEYYLEFGEKGRMINKDTQRVYFCTEVGKPVPGEPNTVKLTGAGLNGFKQPVDIYLPETDCRVTPFVVLDGKPCYLSSMKTWATINGKQVDSVRNNYRLFLPLTPTAP